MSADSDRDQHYSEILFTGHIQPLLEDYLNVHIIPVEGIDTPLARALDLRSGVDYAICTDTDVMGLSNRTQYNKDWSTFTVRSRRDSGYYSELFKRYHARFKGYFAPHLVCQAYFKFNPIGCRTIEQIESIPLLSFAIARDVDVIEIAASNVAKDQHTREHCVGQSGFKVISWSDVIRLRCPILVYSYEDGFSGFVNGHRVPKSQLMAGLFNRVIRPRLKLLNTTSRIDQPLSDYGVIA